MKKTEAVISTQRRQLSAHPKLIFDTIARQAGSVEKAILEGVMNAVDAQATKCEVTLSPGRIDIQDDGEGFQTQQQIDECFEKFGQPHTEQELLKKTYGTFRIGRGQMFAFGKNTWRTGIFQMELDVKTQGLDYDLHLHKKRVTGCHITIDLHEQLLPSDLIRIRRVLAEWVRWVRIPVYVDKKLLSQDPAEAKWEHVTDEAYISLTEKGTLDVYNLGVQVLSMHAHFAGCGGTIVSRKQLKVNVARNEVQSDCPVWRLIRPFVLAKARDKVDRQPALRDATRQRMWEDLLAGERTWGELEDRGIVKLCTGRSVPLRQLPITGSRFAFVSEAPDGDRKGDSIHRRGLAFVLSVDLLNWCNVTTAQELYQKIQDIYPWQSRFTSLASFVKALPAYKPLAELAAGMSDEHTLVDKKDYTTYERVWLELIRESERGWTWSEGIGAAFRPRKVVIGDSPTAHGWTDGSTYIAIERQFVKDCGLTMAGACRMGHLLLHEYCHDQPDLRSHVHDQDFYERFHDRTEHVGRFAAAVVPDMVKVAEKFELRLRQAELRSADTAAAVESKGKTVAASAK